MDEWVVDERASIKDDLLTIAGEEVRYSLSQAVNFVADVGDGSDPHKLVGRVKEVSALEKMGAEHYMDSVLVGDSAYKVVSGFIGEPVLEIAPTLKARAADISGAVMTQTLVPEKAEPEDRELLAKFLLDNL
jgi:hypothetical protein